MSISLHKSILTLMAAACALASAAQDAAPYASIAEAAAPVTAVRAFNAAPIRVLPMLDKNTRLDMIDYFEAGSAHESGNAYGGQSRITAMDDRSLTFTADGRVAYQVIVVDPRPGRSVVGIIETIDTPIPDSSIKLYDRFWRQLPAPAPTLADWLAKGADRKAAEQLPFVMATYEYDPDTNTLTAIQHMDQHYAPGEQPEALSMIRKQIAYVWDGKKFKLRKQ